MRTSLPLRITSYIFFAFQIGLLCILILTRNSHIEGNLGIQYYIALVIFCLSIIQVIGLFIYRYQSKKKIFRFTFISLLPILLAAPLVFWDRLTIIPDTDNKLIIEAHDMQYACGDWIDDMNVTYINDSNYQWLIGRDIDPVIYLGQSNIGSILSTDTEPFSIKGDIRLFGYISKNLKSGCESTSPRFWITQMEHLDGTVINLTQ
ncbi:MAG: hypothetical protein COA58_03565 [Bacteroidetes bacterium]|nr:MAG: hypothetical protein COA58_03565 [Bacteroidota bacterium]